MSSSSSSTVVDQEPEKPKEPSAAENTAEAKKIVKREEKKETAKRLKSIGFVAKKGIGYTFRGVDPKKIDAARSSKKEKEKEIIPDPKMKIGPMSASGVILIDFN